MTRSKVMLLDQIQEIINRISDVMGRMLASSAVDHGFEP
jgi:hypothetical protein